MGFSSLIVGFLFLTTAEFVPGTQFLEDFSDGDYTTAQGNTGLSWTLLSGQAAVVSGQLQAGYSNTLIVSDQRININEFTIRFFAWNTWSNPSRFVFLYKNPTNYYWLGLGNNAGIYRVMNGAETKLYDDATSKLRLPHLSAATNTYKIYVKNTGSAIQMKFDRGADGCDYDVQLTDSDPAAAALFTGTGIGAMSTGTASAGYYRLDDIEITSGLRTDIGDVFTYYVDAVTGDDGRTAIEATNPATPWKTIQRAATVVTSLDTVKVKPGVYREMVTPVYSGSAASPVTYQAFDPDNKPVLDGSEPVSTGVWQQVSVTNYAGVVNTAYTAPINWLPSACYQDLVRMFSSQEPNQSVPEDPYDLAEFRDVPAAYNPGTSTTVLIDPALFYQTDPNYWVGASLLLYDGYPNAVYERKIVQYIPAENKIVTEPFTAYIGPNQGRADKYAIRNYKGCMDQPGEFYVDTATTPDTLYVIPYTGVAPELVTAGKYDHAFELTTGGKSGIVVDGFDIRYYENNAFDIQNHAAGITIRNCDIHHNMLDGVYARTSDGISVESSAVYDNYDNGIGFGDGVNYSVIGCEVTGNGNNGVWAGSGSSSQIYVTDGVTVRGCYIHRQGGRRMHPDNYQMQQCQNVLLENNIFIQEGHQNLWCQFNNNVVLRNNIFMGGPLGLNSVITNELYHNIFYNSGLRYDAHLTDAPIPDTDYYLPQNVTIRNNAIIESSISWPLDTLVDRHAVYTVDHNYYNIENSYTRSGWDFNGYRFGVYRGGGSTAIASPVQTSAEAEFRALMIWSAWGRFICLYKDADNYYSFGMGTDKGIFRKMNGSETNLYSDSSSLIRMPHTSTVWSDYRVAVTNTGTAVEIRVARDQADDSWDVIFSDPDPVAVTNFAGAFRMGVMNSDTNTGTANTYIDDVLITSGTATNFDNFDDGDYDTADGANGMTWAIVAGSAEVNLVGGSGVGYGTGSILHTNKALLGGEFVQPPDALYTNFDMHLTSGSVLRDAGLNSGIATDLEGSPRFQGTAPDIGPYEYNLSQAGSLPVTVSADPADGTFTLSGVEGELAIATASGSPVGQVVSENGVARIDTKELSMKPGLYRISTGSREWRIAML